MLNEISREELYKIIMQLEQALYNHHQWHNSFLRTLICRLAPDYHDLGQTPEQECRFGQWYYKESPQILRDHPGFKAIGESHFQMHKLARALLQKIEAQLEIPPYDYDNFANMLERMVLEVRALKREVEGVLNTQDPLTHVINRLNMLPMLREYQALSLRSNQSCCIAMMDIDNFKEVNDQHGHSAGDKILVAATHYISRNLRPCDKIFRYGGEEFLISFPNTELETALQLVDLLRQGIEELAIEINPDQFLRFTASFGLASLDPHLSIEESIDHADKALYSAKTLGRNRVKAWDVATK